MAALIGRGHRLLDKLAQRSEVRGVERGQVQGLVEGLIAVLGVRGLVPSEAELDTMRSADAATLSRWLAHARIAGSVAEILAS